MDSATPQPGVTSPESGLLVCLAAIARALHAGFEPGPFLDDFSTALQPIVSHDALGIAYLADDNRTFSIFGKHRGSAFLPVADRYTTDLRGPARFARIDSPLAAVFDGGELHVSELLTDTRFVDAGDLRAVGPQSTIAVPLLSGNRVIGALSAGSRVAHAYGDVHVQRLRTVGSMIGPFVEVIALLFRERRRRHRMDLLTGITKMLGTTLDLREILAPVGEAVRPAIAFDAMGVIMLTPSTGQWTFFGTAGEPPVPGIESIPVSEFSYGAALMAGRSVLFDEATKQADSRLAGDRALLGARLQSCLWVPMRFGDEVGGSLFFGKHEPRSYDSLDVEVATVVAGRVVLGIQHQRLAEEQRRVAVVERRARTLEQSLKTARSELHQRYGFDQIIGRSAALREALTRAAQVARTETTVLITGESGTGKELVARAIHYESPRAEGPFVAVNCAALPDTLLESELFGHERGAFTGADRMKPGRFELAAHGTLFLDEIGELSPGVQVKLLRVLQEREFQRVGGTATLKADVRLVAATNRDLMGEIAAGQFRSDLYYRLGVFNVDMPPLRERGEDVLLVADALIRRLAPQMGKGDVTLSRDARDLLCRHPWPGNIRELQNAIERGLITCEGSLITAAHLAVAAVPPPGAPPRQPEAAPSASSSVDLEELERKAIVEALERTHGHKARAAKLLGLTRFQLYSRLKRYGIDVPGE